LDLIERGKLILSKAQFVVLDEADVMLDMGFSKSVEKILSYTPQKKQVMLFCVDLPSEVLQLARRHLRFPKHVKLVSEDKSAQSVSQCFYQVPSGRKLPVLIHLLKTIKPEKAIVFCKTKHGVRNLARDLDANGFPAEGIQGNLTQGQRDRVMKAFKEGSLKLLVATDVASRGIHVDRISHVFNYELPHDINFYVHRIGRTGRMHAVGEAITLVYSDELGALGQIERLMGKEIQEKKISWEIGEAKHAPREERRFSRGFHGGGRGGGREFRGGGRFGRGGFNSGRRTFSRPPRRQMG
jgi:superfamily II DNA/RNA helicase